MNVKLYIEQKNGKQIPITLRDGTTGQIEAFQFYPASGNLELLFSGTGDNWRIYTWIKPNMLKKGA
jgi:hypothetical protein